MFLRRYRLGAAERDAGDAPEDLRPAATAEAARYRRALDRLESSAATRCALSGRRTRARRVALIPSAATHAVLPLLATAAGRRLQIDAGLRSHRRRFGEADGFWLPECAYRPGLEPLLAERGLRFFCADQSAHEPGLGGAGPRPRPGPAWSRSRSTGRRLSWSGRSEGYPSDSAYAEFHRLSLRGDAALGRSRAAPYDPEAAAASAPTSRPATSWPRSPRASSGYRSRAWPPGLLTFAIDTELLGHWWSEGPRWLEACSRGPRRTASAS